MCPSHGRKEGLECQRLTGEEGRAQVVARNDEQCA